MTIDFETSRIRRDWIVLSGISLRCVFGLYDWEQRSAQALVVEVAMALDLDGAAGGDLSASVDYAAVLNQIGFIAVVLAVIAFVRRIPMRMPRWAELIPPYTIGSIAMFWVIQRVAAF